MPTQFGSKRSFAIASQTIRHAHTGDGWHSFLLVLNDTLHSLTDPVEVEAQACRLLGQALKVDRVAFLEINEAEDRITIAREALRNGAAAAVGDHKSTDFAWAVAIFKRRQCLVVKDTQDSTLVPEESRASVAALAVIGCIGAPVVKGDVLVGALCAAVQFPRDWAADELWLLENVAERIWSTILQARTAQALRAKTLELEQQAAQLRRLASELTLAEHNTRQLLSKTLHDGLQQCLYATKFALDAAEEQVGPDESLERAKSNLGEAIAAARSLSVDLFPPVLQNHGLPEALEWLASWMHKKYQKEIIVEAAEAANLETQTARILTFESVRELIFNSVKYAEVPVVQVRATLTPDDEVCVEVSDNGRGFAAESVFPSVSTDNTLGLMSIRERLKILGGRMTIDSSPGYGCRVELRIPRQSTSLAGEPSPQPTTQRAVAPSTSTGDQYSLESRRRVLIVDDHQACREGLRALLGAREELEVVGEARDGAEAIKKVSELNPDVVVMDVSMPVLNGVEATEVISSRFPHVKVFGLSMFPTEIPGVHPILRVGASGLFSKLEGTHSLVEALIKDPPPPRRA